MKRLLCFVALAAAAAGMAMACGSSDGSTTGFDDDASAGGGNGGGTGGGGGQHDGSTSGGDGSTAGCGGGCPSGYTCGSANGHPVCKDPAGIPLFTHVFFILMENTSLATLQADWDAGSANTPYLQSLAAKGATSANYHGVTHPSLPNYIALTSGDTQGIGCDCSPTGSTCNGVTCNRFLGSCGCTVSATHIGDVLESAGKTWRAYGEGMGTPCNNVNADDAGFATRHVPFLYYSNVTGNAARCASHVVDYAAFAADLAAGPSAFSFIAPNLTDDMHSPVPSGAGNLQAGDAWLKTNAQAILDSSAYKSGGLLVIVWDEDDNSGLPTADAPIPMFVLSPYAKSGGYVSQTHADHYALLTTLQDGLGLTKGIDAGGAAPLTDFFPAN